MQPRDLAEATRIQQVRMALAELDRLRGLVGRSSDAADQAVLDAAVEETEAEDEFDLTCDTGFSGEAAAHDRWMRATVKRKAAVRARRAVLAPSEAPPDPADSHATLMDVYIAARGYIEAGEQSEHHWQELASAVESYREVHEPAPSEAPKDAT